MTLSIAPEPIPIELNADGVARVGGTRVTLETVIGTFNEGATPEEIVCRYDTLRLADVYAVISYYLRHRAEVDAYLQEVEREAWEIRQQNEQRFGLSDVRARLLARRAESMAPRE